MARGRKGEIIGGIVALVVVGAGVRPFGEKPIPTSWAQKTFNKVSENPIIHVNDVTDALDFNIHEDTSTKTYDSKGFSELKELYQIDLTKTGDHANYHFYVRVEVEVGLLKPSVLIITHQGDKWYTGVGGVKSEVTETMVKTNLALTFGFFVPVEPNGTLSHSESLKELDNIEHQRLHINGYSRGTDSNVVYNVASTIAFAEQKLTSYRIEEKMVEGEAIKSTTTFDLRFN